MSSSGSDGGGGGGLTFGDVKELLPNFIFWPEVQNLGEQVKEAGGPIRWVNRRIVQFILGAVGAAVFGIAEYIEMVWSTFTYAFVSAGAPIEGIITNLGTDVYVLLLDIHEIIWDTAALAGPLAPVLVLGLYAVVFYMTFVVLRAAAPAATDLLGSIPFIGSIVDAILTFLIQVIDRLAGYVGGSD